jgi:hypothetical protein
MRLQETGAGLFTTEYGAHALHLLRNVQRLMKNVDSADVTEGDFQATFAELFVGLVRGGGGLKNVERLRMASYMGRMLKSARGISICSNDVIRSATAEILLEYAKPGLTQQSSDSIQKILNARVIRELLIHWGFEPAT